ncbi:hypothetical protein ACAF76_008575 [Brevibacillus sp. TJ4]
MFTLYAIQQGMTSVSLKYCRPWDANDCPNFLFYMITISSQEPH